MQDVLNATKIILADKVYSSEFENALAESFAKNSIEESEEITIDMSNIAFIDVVALLNITAFVQKIVTSNRNCRIYFNLPNSNQVLLFLRSFKFYQAIEFATETPFEDFLNGQNLEIYEKELNQQQKYFELKRSKLSQIDSENVTKLINEGAYFAIKSFRIIDEQHGFINTEYINTKTSNEFEKRNIVYVKNNLSEKISIVQQSAYSWKEPKISDVLNRNLKDKHGRGTKDYVPSRIIYECLTNAFRHPRCNLIQTISKFNNEDSRDDFKSNHFSIAFWDNGKSMIDVLGDAIKNKTRVKAPVRAYKSDEDYPDFYIKYKDSNGKMLYRNGWKVSSSIDPIAKEYNQLPYFLFPATFFPGITTRLDGLQAMGTDTSIEPTAWNNPGMGLSLLLNTVVDIFNGKIIVRSGKFRMILRSFNPNVPMPEESEEYINPSTAITKSDDDSSLTSKKSYVALIREIPKTVPEFLGNLIAIHLPIAGN